MSTSTTCAFSPFTISCNALLDSSRGQVAALLAISIALVFVATVCVTIALRLRTYRLVDSLLLCSAYLFTLASILESLAQFGVANLASTLISLQTAAATFGLISLLSLFTHIFTLLYNAYIPRVSSRWLQIPLISILTALFLATIVSSIVILSQINYSYTVNLNGEAHLTRISSSPSYIPTLNIVQTTMTFGSIVFFAFFAILHSALLLKSYQDNSGHVQYLTRLDIRLSWFLAALLFQAVALILSYVAHSFVNLLIQRIFNFLAITLFCIEQHVRLCNRKQHLEPQLNSFTYRQRSIKRQNSTRYQYRHNNKTTSSRRQQKQQQQQQHQKSRPSPLSIFSSNHKPHISLQMSPIFHHGNNVSARYQRNRGGDKNDSDDFDQQEKIVSAPPELTTDPSGPNSVRFSNDYDHDLYNRPGVVSSMVENLSPSAVDNHHNNNSNSNLVQRPHTRRTNTDEDQPQQQQQHVIVRSPSRMGQHTPKPHQDPSVPDLQPVTSLSALQRMAANELEAGEDSFAAAFPLPPFMRGGGSRSGSPASSINNKNEAGTPTTTTSINTGVVPTAAANFVHGGAGASASTSTFFTTGTTTGQHPELYHGHHGYGSGSGGFDGHAPPTNINIHQHNSSNGSSSTANLSTSLTPTATVHEVGRPVQLESRQPRTISLHGLIGNQWRNSSTFGLNQQQQQQQQYQQQLADSPVEMSPTSRFSNRSLFPYQQHTGDNSRSNSSTTSLPLSVRHQQLQEQRRQQQMQYYQQQKSASTDLLTTSGGNNINNTLPPLPPSSSTFATQNNSPTTASHNNNSSGGVRHVKSSASLSLSKASRRTKSISSSVSSLTNSVNSQQQEHTRTHTNVDNSSTDDVYLSTTQSQSQSEAASVSSKTRDLWFEKGRGL